MHISCRSGGRECSRCIDFVDLMRCGETERLADETLNVYAIYVNAYSVASRSEWPEPGPHSGVVDCELSELCDDNNITPHARGGDQNAAVHNRWCTTIRMG